MKSSSSITMLGNGMLINNKCIKPTPRPNSTNCAIIKRFKREMKAQGVTLAHLVAKNGDTHIIKVSSLRANQRSFTCCTI
jgi:hypothetical protein